MKTWWLACSAELKKSWLCPRCAVPKPTHLWTFATLFQTIFAPKNEGRTTAHLLRGDFISGAKLLIVWELHNKKGWFLLGDGHIFCQPRREGFLAWVSSDLSPTDRWFVSIRANLWADNLVRTTPYYIIAHKWARIFTNFISTETRFLSTDLTDYTDACIVTLAAGGCAECKREATCKVCRIWVVCGRP